MNAKMNYEADDQEINPEILGLAEKIVNQTNVGDVDECYEWLVNGDSQLSNLADLWVEFNSQS